MKKKVILIHGYFRNYKDMIDLKKNLEILGYEGILINLPLTFKNIEYATSIFEEKVNKIISNLKKDEKISFVGHSTGGLVIRLFLSNTKYINKINRCILIATPNEGSQLADIASKLSRIFINIFKTLRSLKCKNVEKLDLIHRDKIEIGAIAGKRSNLILGKLIKKDNDGRVEVSSVVYEGLKDFIIIPYNHIEIHHKFKVAKLVDNFLKNGSFLHNTL